MLISFTIGMSVCMVIGVVIRFVGTCVICADYDVISLNASEKLGMVWLPN